MQYLKKYLQGYVIDSFIEPAIIPTDTITSIDDLSVINLLKIAPNPTFGIVDLLIEKNNFQLGVIQILNAVGKAIYSDVIEVGLPKQIDLSNQPQGIYLIKVLLENNQPLCRKLIKR